MISYFVIFLYNEKVLINEQLPQLKPEEIAKDVRSVRDEESFL